jgi:hypothetical protein
VHLPKTGAANKKYLLFLPATTRSSISTASPYVVAMEATLANVCGRKTSSRCTLVLTTSALLDLAHSLRNSILETSSPLHHSFDIFSSLPWPSTRTGIGTGNQRTRLLQAKTPLLKQARTKQHHTTLAPVSWIRTRIHSMEAQRRQ